MTRLSYTLDTRNSPQIGLIVLQADLRLERDFRTLLPSQVNCMVSRVPSSAEVSSDSLQAIGPHLTAAAALLPHGAGYDAVAYGCTSGAAQLGPAGVARRVRAGCPTAAVSDPLTALIAACQHLGLRRLALLSPYVAPVSERLRTCLSDAGIETPVFASFEEPSEARVAAISQASTQAGVLQMMAIASAPVDGVFLSCTNLATLDIVAPLEAALGLPVMSSNLVLAWHMLRLAGQETQGLHPAQLFAKDSPAR